HGPGAVVQERRRCPLAGHELVGEGDDLPSTRLCDEVERPIQRLPRYTRATMVAVDEEARDAPRRRSRLASVVLLAVVDARQLVRAAVLAPRDSVVPVEDERSVRYPLVHESAFERRAVVAVLRGVLGVTVEV